MTCIYNCTLSIGEILVDVKWNGPVWFDQIKSMYMISQKCQKTKRYISWHGPQEHLSDLVVDFQLKQTIVYYWRKILNGIQT